MNKTVSSGNTSACRTAKVRCRIAVTVLLATIAVACSQAPSPATEVLDYADMVLLDAENLSEGGIGTAYRQKILPLLKRHVPAPAEVAEKLDADAPSYTVAALGRTYAIYAPQMDVSAGQNWGNATFALFDIVNRQMAGSAHRFYAVNAGNDLGGLFLTEETYRHAVSSIGSHRDRPYLPTRDPPWYGQPHD